MHRIFRLSAAIVLCATGSLLWAARAAADDKQPQPVTVKYRICGLFSEDREADLQAVAKKLHDVTLSQVDYANGEVTFAYDSTKVLKGAKPDQVLHNIDEWLRTASNQTFNLRALSAIPREKLQQVEIAVGVLDCKACGLGLYRAVANLPGVEQALANYKVGRVTAWIDPAQIDRAKIIEALKQREIRVKEPEKKPEPPAK